MLRLNEKHSQIVGDSLARYYQKGKYYDASGNELTQEEAGVPAEQGRVMLEARLGAQAETESAAERARLEEEARKEAAAREAAAANARADALLGTDDVAAMLEDAETLEDATAVVERLNRQQIKDFITEKLEMRPHAMNSKTGIADNIQLILGAWKVMKDGDMDPEESSDEVSEGESSDSLDA